MNCLMIIKTIKCASKKSFFPKLNFIDTLAETTVSVFHWQLFSTFFGRSLATSQLYEAEALKKYRKVFFVALGVMNMVIFDGKEGLIWTQKRPEFILQLLGCQMIPNITSKILMKKIAMKRVTNQS